MPRTTRVQRIAITPSPELRALLERLKALAGDSLSKCAAELLEEVRPVVEGQIEAMEAIARRPQQAAELIQEYANAKINEIAQTSLQFTRSESKRGRGHVP